jgi:hypothetical protein
MWYVILPLTHYHNMLLYSDAVCRAHDLCMLLHDDADGRAHDICILRMIINGLVRFRTALHGCVSFLHASICTLYASFWRDLRTSRVILHTVCVAWYELRTSLVILHTACVARYELRTSLTQLMWIMIIADAVDAIIYIADAVDVNHDHRWRSWCDHIHRWRSWCDLVHWCSFVMYALNSRISYHDLRLLSVYMYDIDVRIVHCAHLVAIYSLLERCWMRLWSRWWYYAQRCSSPTIYITGDVLQAFVVAYMQLCWYPFLLHKLVMQHYVMCIHARDICVRRACYVNSAFLLW